MDSKSILFNKEESNRNSDRTLLVLAYQVSRTRKTIEYSIEHHRGKVILCTCTRKPTVQQYAILREEFSISSDFMLEHPALGTDMLYCTKSHHSFSFVFTFELL